MIEYRTNERQKYFQKNTAKMTILHNLSSDVGFYWELTAEFRSIIVEYHGWVTASGYNADAKSFNTIPNTIALNVLEVGYGDHWSRVLMKEAV